MRKEEVYLDLTKLTKEQLINVAESVKDDMFNTAYKDLSKGIKNYKKKYLVWYRGEWARCSLVNSRKEITIQEFLINFGKMTETEKKLYDYAVSVDWDFEKISNKINEVGFFTWCEYERLEGFEHVDKINIFIEKYKPKEPIMITLPIEDYNRLRKLEIKQEIKRLKRELKGL